MSRSRGRSGRDLSIGVVLAAAMMGGCASAPDDASLAQPPTRRVADPVATVGRLLEEASEVWGRIEERIAAGVPQEDLRDDEIRFHGIVNLALQIAEDPTYPASFETRVRLIVDLRHAQAPPDGESPGAAIARAKARSGT